MIVAVVSMSSNKFPKGSYLVADLSFALGVLPQTIRNIDTPHALDCNLSGKGKHCLQLKQKIYMPLHYFKKKRRFNSSGEVFDGIELQVEFEALNPDGRVQREQGANDLIVQMPFLKMEIDKYLRKKVVEIPGES